MGIYGHKFDKLLTESTDLESFFKNTEGNHKVSIDLKDDSIGIDKVKKVAYSNKNKAMSEIKKYIDEIYNDWYDKDDDGYLTKNEVKKLAMDLFDVIDIRKGSKGINIDYWVNSFSSHKRSNEFFGNHSVAICITIDPKTFKVVEVDKPQLEG